MFSKPEEFINSKLFNSYTVNVQKLVKVLFRKLDEGRLEYVVHARERNFVLWASPAVHKKRDRDFLTVIISSMHIMLMPKFYHVSWKSEETNRLKRVVADMSQLDNEYLKVIHQSYGSIVDAAARPKTAVKSHIPGKGAKDESSISGNMRADVSDDRSEVLPNDLREAFQRFRTTFQDDLFVRVAGLFEKSPDLAITGARTLLERLLKTYYQKLKSRDYQRTLDELIKELQIIGQLPRFVFKHMHLVRKSGNEANHEKVHSKYLKHEALMTLRSLSIIAEMIEERLRSE